MINSIQFKADIAINEVEMSRLRQIACEAKKFHTNLEQIELLKMEHVESAELNVKVNELFTAFNNLCVSTLQNEQYFCFCLHTMSTWTTFVSIEITELRPESLGISRRVQQAHSGRAALHQRDGGHRTQPRLVTAS